MDVNQFLGMAVHDLRTPVHRIVLAADLLGIDTLPEAKRKEMLALIQRSAFSLVELIDDLLQVTRLQSGQFQLKKERLALLPFLKQICTEQEILAAQRGQRIILDAEGVSATELITEADPARLTQVLNNLLNNAMKYSPDRSDISVRVRSESDAFVKISVIDQGPGIAQSEQIKLFQPFHTSTAGARHGEKGTGLGLTIAKTLVELHGGSIGVNSEVNCGAEFFVRLPSSRPSEQ